MTYDLIIKYLEDILEDLKVSPGCDLMQRCIGAAEAFRELGLINDEICDKYVADYTDVYLVECLDVEDILESDIDKSH
jgi:hypothetical protein